MVYHERMGRQPAWVGENISWFCERLEPGDGPYPKVWPIVQAHDDPGEVTENAFETVLRGGLSGCSDGVMMFTTRLNATASGSKSGADLSFSSASALLQVSGMISEDTAITAATVSFEKP